MNNSKNIAIALLALLEEGISVDKITKDFSQYIEHHKLESQLPEIVRQMEKLNNAKNKFEQVEIQTAHETSKELLQKIRDHIKAPKDATIENKINTNLIGGFIAKYKGVEFDTSLKTQLKKLQESLITA